MRLIDADKLMEKLGECFYDTTNPAARRAAHDTMALCQSLVEEQHTAYDVDKVVKQLKELREEILSDTAYDNDTVNHFLDYADLMIEAVKSGYME